jgi:hypothetical protein
MVHIEKSKFECPICHKVLTKSRGTSHFLRVHDPKRAKKPKEWVKFNSGGKCSKCKKYYTQLWQHVSDNSKPLCRNCMRSRKAKQRAGETKQKNKIIFTAFETNPHKH